MTAGAALRERVARHLAERSHGVLSGADGEGAWALPVRYRAATPDGLALTCLVPRWTDAAYHAPRSKSALLVVADDGAQRWLLCSGRVEPVTTPDWHGLLPQDARARELMGASPEDLYVALRLTATRVELVDERRGWGVRENLDL